MGLPVLAALWEHSVVRAMFPRQGGTEVPPYTAAAPRPRAGADGHLSGRCKGKGNRYWPAPLYANFDLWRSCSLVGWLSTCVIGKPLWLCMIFVGSQ